MGRKAIAKQRNTNQKRREKYLKKLAPIFYKYGLRTMSMDDICEKLNVSKATLYNYFSSKEEMVEAILQNILNSLSAFEGIIHDEKRSFLSRYFASIELVTKNLAGISNLFLNDLKSLYPNLWIMVERFKDFATGVLEWYYIEGKKLGILNDLNTNILILSDQIFFDALSELKILEENNLTMETAIKDYFKLKVMGMINTQVGKKHRQEALELIDQLKVDKMNLL